jgi:hypothetical protein
MSEEFKLPFAEDVGHYWKTSSISPDSWLSKSADLIRKHGGKILSEAFGMAMGQGAFMLTFEVKGESFKIMWPVLPSKTRDEKSARRQAATLMFYDVKAKLMTASVLGFKTAFFQYVLLQDGRTAGEMATPELAYSFPPMLKGVQ